MGLLDSCLSSHYWLHLVPLRSASPLVAFVIGASTAEGEVTSASMSTVHVLGH